MRTILNTRKILGRNILKFNNLITFLLAFIILISSYNIAIQKDWHLSTHNSLHGWFSMNVGATISSMKYDLNGYLGYIKIFKLIESNRTLDDNVLQKALKLSDVASEGIYTMEESDFGFQVFSRVAFTLFGYSVSSLLYLYYVILIFSVLLYLATFNKDNAAKVLLLVFLLSFTYITPLAERLGYNVGVIYSSRFMSLLAILPIIHICIFALKTKTKRFLSYFALTAQSIILASVYFIRSSMLWMFILLLFLIFLTISIIIKEYLQVDSLSVKVSSLWDVFVKSVRKTVPMFLVLCVFIIMKIIVTTTMSPIYQEKGLSGQHIIWHSIFIGLAINPDIRKKYTDKRPHENSQVQFEMSPYSDNDAYDAAFKWLKENGKSEYEFLNINPNEPVDLPFSRFRKLRDGDASVQLDGSAGEMIKGREFNWLNDMKWSEYEKVLYEVVKSVVITHPFQVFETTFIRKPIRLLNLYIKYYLNGWPGSLIYDMKFLVLAMITLTYCILSLRQSPADNFQSYLRVLLMIFLFSTILPLVVYPSSFTMADNALLFTMCIFCFIVSLMLLMISISKKLLSLRSD